MHTALLAQDQIPNKLIGHAKRVCVPDLKSLPSLKHSCCSKAFILDGHEQIE